MKILLVATIAAVATAQSNSSFTQCLDAALGSDASLYSTQQGAVRPFNLNYVTTPAAYTFPKTAQQVSEVVKCAHTAKVAVQARSGGHSYANYGLGGFNGSLVVDMKNMGAFAYKEDDQTVTFEPGNLLGNLSQKLQPLNRVIAYGEVGVIGSGGHLTIGGLGMLSRQLGLGADQIVSAQCVLGNGTIVTASATSNPDLFFAIRGAGFSFAIVTEFTVKTAPAPSDITQYTYNVTAKDITSYAGTFEGWQKLVSQPNFDRRFSSTITLSATGMIIAGTYYGSRNDFDALNIPSFMSGNDSSINMQSTITTSQFKMLGDPALTASAGFPLPFYAKSVKTTNATIWSRSAINDIFSYINATDKGSIVWLVIWDLEGGAIADIAQNTTAYWNRDALYFMQNYIVSLTGSVSDASKNFLNGLSKLVQEKTGADQSAYPGYVDPALENPQKSYWGENVQRLQTIKATLDPDNVFRNPQSVMVTGGNGTSTPPVPRQNMPNSAAGLSVRAVLSLVLVVGVAMCF